MESWVRNEVASGWLVDPYKKQVLVYEAEKRIARRDGPVVKGMGLVESFTLNLKNVLPRHELEQQRLTVCHLESNRNVG